MSTNKKRRLLMMGIALIASIPTTEIISHNIVVSKTKSESKVISKENEPKNDILKEETNKAIESALYNQVEFFETTALVPIPTASACNKLLEVAKRFPQTPLVYKQLAKLEVELGNKELAETSLLKYVSLSNNSLLSLQELASFYQEQAEFEKQADTLNKMFETAPDEEKDNLLKNIISLANKHKLKKYLGASFYKENLDKYPDNFTILQQYINKLLSDKDYKTALTLVNDYRQNLPNSQHYFLNKQADILLDMNRWQEAKELYIKEFDPFWPDEIKNKFYYDILSRNDQLNTYGQELRKSFQKKPSSFDFAIRLIDYHEHYSNSDLSQYVFYKLEEAKSKNNVDWQPKELILLARLSLKKGYAERASKYIYTLYNQGHLKPNSELRGQLLYQLFELLIDTQYERLPLTKGNLKFYQNIAQSDPNPGVIGGILSLIFSDSKPKQELSQAETNAIPYFNQAAAYRIFSTYKKEFPTSPQLAQMYLDIIRFYTDQGNTEVADKTLEEFEVRYKNSNQFAQVAIKLADAYLVANNKEKELATYQKILDYLGQNTRSGQLLKTSKIKLKIQEYGEENQDENYENQTNTKDENLSSSLEPTQDNPNPTFEELNVNIKSLQGSSNDSSSVTYIDYLAENNPVNYSIVLNRYIYTLNQENQTEEIINLFNNEIKKYPNEQGLYEQLLQWLGRTNLVEEQLKVYEKAIKKFPSTRWYDRMARWFIRQDRKEEFEKFSKELLAKFDEKQINDYLNKFVYEYSFANYSFGSRFYLAFYTYAHNRFPQNQVFVQGLLDYYSFHKEWGKWKELVGKYYFIWPEIRNSYLSYLSQNNELREYLSISRKKLTSNINTNNELLAYKLFRADAAIWLCNYEEAIDAYRELNQLYPGNKDFADQLVKLTRSFGQIKPKFLTESASVQIKQTTLNPGLVENHITVGELYAEANDYQKAKVEWLKLLDLGKDKQTYLDTATLFWDYYQYDDALHTIEKLRVQEKAQTLFAFEAGAILEAKHQMKDAITEYIKGISETETDNDSAYKNQNRLATLYNRPGLSKEIDAVFTQHKKQIKSPEKLILGYAEVLKQAQKPEKVSQLLKQAMEKSTSIKFLKQVRRYFASQKDSENEITAIKLCLKNSISPREKIGYRLQLISLYRKNNDKLPAIKLLQELIREYPFNYGVINEVVNNYWYVGLTANAIQTLEQAISHSKGRFYYEFSRRLAARHLDLNNIKTAQIILEKLFQQDKLNSEVLDDLTSLYIRTENRDALERCLLKGLEAIESQEMAPRDLRLEIAFFRSRMIKNFTTIKDYSAAIKQHIEIINRNPEDESRLADAISYVERYGGGDELIAYYQNVFQQAYKNYRWAVILARIYKAKGETENVIKYYQAAIDNQPEKAELYATLAESFQDKQDLPSAIIANQKAIEFSNYEITYVKQGIKLLETVGRFKEANNLKAKLPPDPNQIASNTRTIPNTKIAENFSKAEELKLNGNNNFIKTYRKAFEEFYNNPYKPEQINSNLLQNYAQAIHEEDSLSQILQTFWQLRDKLVKETTTSNTYSAARAREILQIVDGALPKAIGDIAQNKASGSELADLHQVLIIKIDALLANQSSYNNPTLLLLENIALGCNFVDVEELILTRHKTYSLDSLINFYESHGNYDKAIQLLEESTKNGYSIGYLSKLASLYALIGNQAKEIQTLNNYYNKVIPGSYSTNTIIVTTDPIVEHYFNLLYEDKSDNLAEIKRLIKYPSKYYHLQLINFLISKKEASLAHEAITNSQLSSLWKNSNNAKLSLALEDYNLINNQYFEHTLNFKTIGQLIKITPKQEEQLIGDNWFEMAYNYGQWLYNTSNTNNQLYSGMMLPALLERKPQDNLEQQRLGEWYLAQNQPGKALNYLLNAEKMGGNSKELFASIGSCYFLQHNENQAFTYWLKILENDQVYDNQLWLNTLKKHSLLEKAREETLSRILKNKDSLESSDIEKYLEILADTFKQDGHLNDIQADAQARYFINLCKSWVNDIFVPQTLIEKNLINVKYVDGFYKILIERSKKIETIDYEYRNYAQLTKDLMVLEERLDHTVSFQTKEPESDQYKWQAQYLQVLLTKGKNKEASELIKEIEKSLTSKYMRPDWLRLANIELLLKKGLFDEAWKQMLHFVKIETLKETTNIDTPSLERLQKSLYLLEKTGFAKAKDDLSQAYYERCLALEQYSLANLIGLANIRYAKGDIDSANNLLALTLEFGDINKQNKAARKISDLPEIKAHSTKSPNVVTPSPTYETSYSSISVPILQAVADLATKHRQYNLAIEQRKLIKQNLKDEQNTLELSRVLAANNQLGESVTTLTEFIADRTTSRSNRWLAVSLLASIIGSQDSLWKITEKITDEEIKLALQAHHLANLGEISTAIKLINNKFNSAEMKFFHATLERKQNHISTAIELLSQLPLYYKPFNAYQESNPLRQMIYLYSAIDASEAVLALAEKDPKIKEYLDYSNSNLSPSLEKLEPLSVIAQKQEHKTTLDLLALSAKAAEKLGKADLAIKFLTALKTQVNDDAQAKIETNLFNLEQRLKLQNHKNHIPWKVSISLLSK